MWAGVPEWRLPRDVIMEEIEIILDLGIDLKLNTKIGVDISFEDLVAQHDAVVIAAGNQNVRAQHPGEDLPGVDPGLTFLEDINLARKEHASSASASSPSVAASPRWTASTVLRLGAESRS